MVARQNLLLGLWSREDYTAFSWRGCAKAEAGGQQAQELLPQSPGAGCYTAVVLPDAVKEILAARPEVKLAVLFGSTARGKTRPGSDVDIGVLLDGEHPETLWHLTGALGSTLRRDVDLVDLAKAPPLLRFEITRDGKLLYERDPDAWYYFKVQALTDWWDWEPTARWLNEVSLARLREEVARGQA
ncbi:MAG TPA: nucleotidyltransferase domain-containing protein [Thermoanaerobaculia bacterium]|nr:nucleotidyltransferase domain-containing protein [Thermoanaerobaculia bacterium]